MFGSEPKGSHREWSASLNGEHEHDRGLEHEHDGGFEQHHSGEAHGAHPRFVIG